MFVSPGAKVPMVNESRSSMFSAGAGMLPTTMRLPMISVASGALHEVLLLNFLTARPAGLSAARAARESMIARMMVSSGICSPARNWPPRGSVTSRLNASDAMRPPVAACAVTSTRNAPAPAVLRQVITQAGPCAGCCHWRDRHEAHVIAEEPRHVSGVVGEGGRRR